MPITITEALAEIKTIGKRIEKKRAAIGNFVARQDGVRDPLEKDGGSFEFIRRERQGIADLGERIVKLRLGIQKANDSTSITVGGETRTISEWLTWRREVAPGERQYLSNLSNQINGVRQQAQRNGASVVTAGTDGKPTDVVINVNEQELAKSIEHIEDVLGALDGQLSLKNATVMIAE